MTNCEYADKAITEKDQMFKNITALRKAGDLAPYYKAREAYLLHKLHCDNMADLLFEGYLNPDSEVSYGFFQMLN